MTTVEMTSEQTSQLPSGAGRIYAETVSLVDPATQSDAYLIPSDSINDIACVLTGDGSIDFTVFPVSAIEDDSAVWETWDGLSQVNRSVTAFRVNRTSGTVVGRVVIRTHE